MTHQTTHSQPGTILRNGPAQHSDQGSTLLSWAREDRGTREHPDPEQRGIPTPDYDQLATSRLSADQLDNVQNVLSSPGRSIDPSTRLYMENRFGHDFSSVRIHADADSDTAARTFDSLAYTIGNNIVFRHGFYSPMTSEGKKLIAHELAHVRQQTAEPEDSAEHSDEVSDLEGEAARASSNLESSATPIETKYRSHVRVACQQAPEREESASRTYLKIEETIADIESWEMGLAANVSDSNIAIKVAAFIPFFFLDLLKRAVQLGNFLFGITELQDAADVIFDTGKSLAQRAKAALWATFITAMNMLMVGGIAERVGLKISGLISRLGKVGWIETLLGTASGFLEQSFSLAREYIPRIMEMMNSLVSAAKTALSWTLSKVTGSWIWQKMISWSKEEIRLPRFIEALSEDLVVVMRRQLGQDVPALGAKAGIGQMIYKDVKLAGQAQELTRAHSAGELSGLSTGAKGEVGEQAGRLVSRLNGMRLTPEDLSKLSSNQGIDHVFVGGQKPFVPVAMESKATSSETSTLSLLSNRAVKAGDPLAQMGVPVGTKVRQASRGFNVDRLLKLAQSGDPQKAAAAKAFIQNLAQMEEMLSITRLKSGTVELYKLEMTPDLFQIAGMEEIITMTFGELKTTYYILVATELSPFASKGFIGAEK